MSDKKGFSHESQDAASVDWYTPQWIFNDIGLTFDIDPCQPIGGIPRIPAKKFYTIEDDGLASEWYGKIWCNPPYGKETKDWLHKMHIHRNGIALVFARTDCAWFHDYVAKADSILFLRGRVKFVDGNGKTGGSGAGSGSMLISWGDECTKALSKLSNKGLLVYPTKSDDGLIL